MNYDKKNASQIMYEHYNNPQYKDLKQKFSLTNQHKALTCYDHLQIGVNINKHNVIESIGFKGTGCVISLSAADIMCGLVKEKTITQAKTIIYHYLQMLENKAYDSTLLKKSRVFKIVLLHPHRKNCAQIIALLLKQVL